MSYLYFGRFDRISAVSGGSLLSGLIAGTLVSAQTFAVVWQRIFGRRLHSLYGTSAAINLDVRAALAERASPQKRTAPLLPDTPCR